MQVEVDNLMIMDGVYYESWNRQEESKTIDDVWAELEDTAWEDERDDNFKEED